MCPEHGNKDFFFFQDLDFLTFWTIWFQAESLCTVQRPDYGVWSFVIEFYCGGLRKTCLRSRIWPIHNEDNRRWNSHSIQKFGFHGPWRLHGRKCCEGTAVYKVAWFSEHFNKIFRKSSNRSLTFFTVYWCFIFDFDFFISCDVICCCLVQL